MSEILTWLENRIPEGWFHGSPTVTIDREEILIIGSLAAPDSEEGTEGVNSVAEEARIARFREETRRQRMRIADETEARYDRKVSWGAECGETTVLFTTMSVPVMTRLRQPERRVLDTLVAAGVARSRSDALAWCVRLVGEHESDWINRLRDALIAVNEARASGPASRTSSQEEGIPEA